VTGTTAVGTGARSGHPPGPRGLPVLGSTLDLLRNPLEFLLEISRRYGDTVAFRMPGRLVYLFNHPDAIEEVLLSEAEHVVKDEFTRRLSLVVGSGLLTSEGAFWKRQRRLAQPAFHHQRVQAYGETMARLAERTAAELRDGEVRDIHRDMMRLTLDVVAGTLFGTDVGPAANVIGEAIDMATERFEGLGTFVPPNLPLPMNRRLHRSLARLDDIVLGMIRARRGSGDTGDLLSMLIAARGEDGEPMSDRQLRDEVVTLLLAGHETTALALSFALHLLGRHPAIEAELRDESVRVLGDRLATATDLPALTVADAVVRETMRLYPPAWAIGREAVEPCRIGGFEIAPGTQLWAAQWVVHRDPRYFPDPDAFVPDRWKGDLARRLPRFAYFPFGGGPRVCIGNAFARMEATLLLSTLVRRARFVPVEASPLALAPSATLRPKGGIRMRIERRAP